MAHAQRALTHMENRKKVCIICMQKAKNPISQVVLQRIRAYFMKDYDPIDACYPSAICSKCRSDLLYICSGKKTAAILPPMFDFGLILPQLQSTRNQPNPICCCQLCVIARQSCTTIPKRKKGRPSSSSLGGPVQKTVIKLCSFCKSLIGKGLSHNCKVSTLRKNMIGLCDDVDVSTREIVASKVVSDKMKTNRKSTALKTRGSSSLVVSSTVEEKPIIDSSQLNLLQVAVGASNTTMKCKIVPFFREVFGKTSVEPYAEQFLQKRDKLFEEYFTVTDICFEDSSSKELIKKPVVYCTNVEEVIYYVCRERNLNHNKIHIKLGIDGGGGLLKFCLNIFENDMEESITNQSGRKLLDKMFLNAGVKKLIIIGISPEVKETYFNIKQILDLLKIEKLPLHFTYALDLKLANITAGIQSHGSTFPCLWCECPKSEFVSESSSNYQLRSLGSIKDKVKAYTLAKQTSKKKVEAKDFKNCVYEPLVSGDDSDIFIYHIPPPELHLLLRVTNKIFNELEKKSEKISCEWIQKLGIKRPKLHSGEFNGNMCKTLLSKVDVLEAIIIKKELFDVMPFVTVFTKFNNVRKSCFGSKLLPDTLQNIAGFRTAYLDLSINVTSAAHVIFDHVFQFCNFHDAGLGKYSEQASESVHSDFRHLWEKCGKRSLIHSEYGQALLQTTIRYNGRHL